MEMIGVESSNISKVGYDEVRQELFVQFKNGGLYKFSHVPESVWANLQDAPSKGKYLTANVRNVYGYTKL